MAQLSALITTEHQLLRVQAALCGQALRGAQALQLGTSEPREERLMGQDTRKSLG